ncbi:putative sporulation transcription regulator WhiA [Clostridium sp. CAG:533]|nr:putative sporulation transcription regulator WhiA [Clostridium sp. CAG:533]
MTFTTQIKEEITKEENNNIEDLTSLCTYLKFNATLEEDKMTVMVVNASVARWIFKLLKTNYNVLIKLTTRTMKRFKARNLYILEVKEKLDLIYKDIDNIFKEISTSSDEEKKAFLKGMFLACGSINDPKKNQYHLEFLVKEEEDARLIDDLLNSLKIKSKVLKRDREYMVYVKSSENISDFIKYLGAFNALFYFEDIRIYKDHKNMVNRLNNCEQANVERTLKSSKTILDNIKYLEDNDLLMLLDDRSKEIIEYKKKYPDTSLGELAEIITMETNKSITKSGINHHFRKINALVKKAKENHE